jgi:hypothetical protein
MRFDAAGVVSEQAARDRVHMCLDRIGEEERLSQPDETIVGVHEDVDEARELVQPERVDACDLHDCSVAR